MFKEWGFLLGEIWVLLLLAALLGLLAGWLFWARRSSGGDPLMLSDMQAMRASNTQLKNELSECRANGADLQTQLASASAAGAVGMVAGASMSDDGEWEQKYHDLRANYQTARDDLDASRIEAAKLQADLNACNLKTQTLEGELEGAQAAVAAPVAAAVAAPAAEATDISKNMSAMMGEDYDGDGIFEGANEGTRPEALTGPRGGQADDLKQIKGVGNKMEILCNKLGFYHFDQIAGWSRDEVAWVDANLEGFKGRVTRDTWVEQAKVLAAGGATEFSKKVAKGDVDY